MWNIRVVFLAAFILMWAQLWKQLYKSGTLQRRAAGLRERMDETQLLEECSEKHEYKEHSVSERGEPLAKLRVLKNSYFPETELPLHLGNNVLGRDPTSCSLVFDAPSVSKLHAVISVSVFPGDKFCDGPVTEALLWDLGSLNGTRKGRFRLTPNVRYALSEGDFLVVADVLCQYATVSEVPQSGEKASVAVARGLRGRGKLRGRGQRQGAERKGQGKGRSDGERDSSIKDKIQQKCEAPTPNPARSIALSLEQTPAQQGKLLELASESDTDEDGGERKDKEQRRQKLFDSPQLSGPTCSAFLSPNNNIVPESEDENSIINGKTKEKDPAGPKRNVLISDSDSEMEESLIHIRKTNENERRPEGNTVNRCQSLKVEKEGDAETINHEVNLPPNVPASGLVGPTVEGQKTSQHGSPRGTHCTSTGDMPTLYMDSDTDVEGEGDVRNVSGTTSEPAVSSIVQSATTDHTAHKTSVTQSGKIHLDSDTEVEDNEESSYTDAEDTDGHPLVTLQSRPLPVSGGQTAAAVPGLRLEIHSDSDSEAEEDSTQTFVCQANAKTVRVAQLEPQQVSSVTAAETVGPVSGPSTETNVQEQDSANQYPETQPLPKHAVDPSDFNFEIATDVEDEEDQAVQGAPETNVTPRVLKQHNCSTPLGSESTAPSLLKLKDFIDNQDNEKDDDDFVVAETQAFVSDAPAASRRVADPILDATQLYLQHSPEGMETSATDAVEDQATQTFSFQLGLPDCSHKQSTTDKYSYALVPLEEKNEGVENPGAIQTHRTAPLSGSTGFVDTDGDLEATQPYGVFPSTVISPLGQDDMRHSVGGTEQGVIKVHTRNAQQVIEEEKVEETQPVDFHADSHLSTADTQLVSALEAREERGLRPEEKVAEEEAEEVVAEPSTQNFRVEQRTNDTDVQPSRSSGRSRGGGHEDEERQIRKKQPAKRMTRRSSKAETKQGRQRRGQEPEEAEESGNAEDEAVMDQSSLTVKRRNCRNPINTINDKENDNSEAARELERDKTEKKIKEVEERQEKNGLDSERKETEEKLQKAEREKEQREKQEQMEQKEKERLETEENGQEREEKERLKEEGMERVKTQCNEREANKHFDIAGKEEQNRLEREGRKKEENERLPSEESSRKLRRGESEKEEQEKLEKERPDQEEKVLRCENKDQEENQKLENKKNKGLAKEEKQRTVKELERENQRRNEETANKAREEQENEKGLKTPPHGRRRKASRTAPSASADSGEDMVTNETESKLDRPGSLVSVRSTKSSSCSGRQTRGKGKSQGTAELEPNPVISASPEVSVGLSKTGMGSKSQIVTDSDPIRMETEIVVAPVEKAVQYSKPNTSKGTNKDQKQCDSATAVVQDPTSSCVLVKRSRRGNKSKKMSDLDTTASESDQTAVAVEAQSNEVQDSKSSGTQRCRKRSLGKDKKETEEGSNFKMGRAIKVSQEVAEMEGEKAKKIEKTEESETQSITCLRRGRASKAKKTQVEVETQEETKEKETGMISVHQVRQSQRAAQKNESEEKKMLEEEQNKETGLGTSSEDLGKSCQTIQVPQTPTARNSRKRSSANVSPTGAKTARRSSSCAADHNTYKVLFTGLTDEQGEATVLRLGGNIAKGVSDMTHLITDKVRRTVKFLCAVARGVPVVTIAWLEKCGKSGTFLSPTAFLVKDVEQEKKFNFCLEESLQTARNQPLLEGYEIHVTRSVKPEPAQMKDIISCSGARYLPKMPTVQKPNTVVISCVEDASLCGPALSASLPVLSAEFLLTGILQQKVDFVTHALTGPLSKAKSACKGRNRK
ncbi:mediator of DNA damage checkpoint protein 1-like [Arapaima gigas]